MKKFILSLLLGLFLLAPLGLGADVEFFSTVTTDLNCTDCVDDTMVDWGTGAGQVSADDIPDGATNAIPTLTQESNWDTAYGWGDHAGLYEAVDSNDFDPDRLAGDTVDDNLIDPGIVNGVKDADYGDLTVTSGVWAVEDDSHDHATTITGKSANVSDADLGDVTITGGSWAVENDSHSHADSTVADVLSLTQIPNQTTDGFVKTSSSDGTLSIDTSTYLTGNETITLSGDATGSGATAITVAVTDDSHNHTNSSITLASTDLSDTADLLYETELDSFSELQSQISDKTLVNEEDAVTWDAAHVWEKTGLTGYVFSGSQTNGYVRFSHQDAISLPTIDNPTTVVIDRATSVNHEVILSLIAGNNANSTINFGDTDDENAGALRYSHVSNDFTVNAPLDVSGAIDANGSITALNGASYGYNLGANTVLNDDGTDIQLNVSGGFTDIKASNGAFKGPHKSSDGTSGATTSCGSGTTLTVKDGLITACA